MVFSSNIFLFLFLPLTLLAYFLPFGKCFKNSLLLVASLTFYAWGETQYFGLLLISILANFGFGIALDNAINNKSEAKNSWSKITIFLAIIFNLSLLGYYKYANFLAENISQILPIKIILEPIHLPIGISFFTFHAISYLVDIYRKKSRAQRNIFDLALYISFFPQLVAGPIIRYNFIEKYLSKRRHSWFFAAYGIRRFVIGLSKKVLIANPLGEVADAVFSLAAGDVGSYFAWIGIICYTLQIYFDFSGYSDMAIGLARIFGFKFPENFNYPYVSKSFREFWRRWHISLSTWFRDYVYIPLGGNQVSNFRQYLNLFLVFFLCGLWHGASWNFIAWGIFHGIFLVTERFFEEFRSGGGERLIVNLLGRIYVMFFVMIGWVFFRSPDLQYAAVFLEKMFFFSAGEESITISRLIESHLNITAFCLALIGSSSFVKNCSLKILRRKKAMILVFDFGLMICLILALIRLSAETHNPFIYFQF